MAWQPLGDLGRLIFRGFTITIFRHTTLGRTPLDEWSAGRRDLYLTTHNTHNRQTFMPSVGFEPAIPASERPQTHALDRTATGIGLLIITLKYLNTSSMYVKRLRFVFHKSANNEANNDNWFPFCILSIYFFSCLVIIFLSSRWTLEQITIKWRVLSWGGGGSTR
jgi:hypothetical protein